MRLRLSYYQNNSSRIYLFSLTVIHFYVDSLARNCQASKAAVFQVIGIRDTVADPYLQMGGGNPVIQTLR